MFPSQVSGPTPGAICNGWGEEGAGLGSDSSLDHLLPPKAGCRADGGGRRARGHVISNPQGQQKRGT